MTKLTIEKINTATAEIIGKTVDSATYSGDAGSREKIKRAYITEGEVGDNMTVRGDKDDVVIRTVKKAEKVEIAVQLLNAEKIDDGRSLATVILRDVWAAPSKENDGMVDIFVERGTNEDQLAEMLCTARKLAGTATGARANGKWYPVVVAKADGEKDTRAIIRIVGAVGKEGKVTSGSDCGSGESL